MYMRYTPAELVYTISVGCFFELKPQNIISHHGVFSDDFGMFISPAAVQEMQRYEP